MEIYRIIYKGDGKFEVIINGESKEAGPNLRGMIRYTFGDTLPEVGWEITNEELMQRYYPKVHRDILDGKIKTHRVQGGSLF